MTKLLDCARPGIGLSALRSNQDQEGGRDEREFCRGVETSSATFLATGASLDHTARMRSRFASFAVLVPLAFVFACSSNTESSGPKTAKAAVKTAPEAPPAPAGPPDKLERTALKTVLPSGLPWILRRVWPEEVVREGKFIGWRLVAIPEEWLGLDVRPDDIVTRVNGKGVETPDQLWEAWTSLATATELRVAYERNNEMKEFVLPIAGEPAPELLASLNSPSPPPRKATTKKGTIVIESRDPAGDPGND